MLKSAVSLIHQFTKEAETFQRTLAFVAEENTDLKNRLERILQNISHEDRAILERIEYFQDGFLKIDEINRFLRGEVASQNRLLIQESYEDGDLIKEVKRSQKKLRKNIQDSEKEFNNLKFEFHDYLQEIL
ncbi:MAG: hypothetical protein ABUT20_53470 [Bacteroidota bacterium]